MSEDMNIEEAIKVLKKLRNTMQEDIDTNYVKEEVQAYNFFIKAIDTIINEYKNQQKEIEELKQEVKEQAEQNLEDYYEEG